MNNLEVKVSQNAGSISFNYDEIKGMLSEQMALYKDATFTEDSKNIAKAEVATLRKIKKAVDDKRKEVKSLWLEPYNDFEEKVKDLIKLIDEPIELIDSQITAFEEARKAEKKAKIESIYAESIGDLADYLPLSKIYNPKWENSTTTIKAITEEIKEVVTSTESAIQTIKGMNSEAVEKALDRYKTNLSLTDAITYINQYEQQKIEIEKRNEEKRKADEERQKQAEIDRIRAEERARIADEERIKEEERKKVLAEEEAKKIAEREAMAVQQEAVGEKAIKVQFTVNCYPAELEQIEMYLSSIGVDYERVDL